MGTESHGGDGGLLEDREDGGDDTITESLPLDAEQRSFSPGGGRRAGGAGCAGIAAAPSEEQQGERRELVNASSQLSNVPLETLRGI